MDVLYTTFSLFILDFLVPDKGVKVIDSLLISTSFSIHAKRGLKLSLLSTKHNR